MASLGSMKADVPAKWELLPPMFEPHEVLRVAGVDGCRASANCRLGTKCYGSGDVALDPATQQLAMLRYCAERPGSWLWILEDLHVLRRKSSVYLCQRMSTRARVMTEQDSFRRACWRRLGGDKITALFL